MYNEKFFWTFLRFRLSNIWKKTLYKRKRKMSIFLLGKSKNYGKVSGELPWKNLIVIIFKAVYMQYYNIEYQKTVLWIFSRKYLKFYNTYFLRTFEMAASILGFKRCFHRNLFLQTKIGKYFLNNQLWNRNASKNLTVFIKTCSLTVSRNFE